MIYATFPEMIRSTIGFCELYYCYYYLLPRTFNIHTVPCESRWYRSLQSEFISIGAKLLRGHFSIEIRCFVAAANWERGNKFVEKLWTFAVRIEETWHEAMAQMPHRQHTYFSIGFGSLRALMDIDHWADNVNLVDERRKKCFCFSFWATFHHVRMYSIACNIHCT